MLMLVLYTPVTTSSSVDDWVPQVNLTAYSATGPLMLPQENDLLSGRFAGDHRAERHRQAYDHREY